MHLPVLRQGKPYRSMDVVEVQSVRTGAPVAFISQANAGLIRRDLRRLDAARDALRAVPAEQLLTICARAGERFMEADLPLGEDSGTQSPGEYVEALSATSGLPHALCRRNMAKIHQVLTQMPTILRGLTRGLDLGVIDRGIGEQASVPPSLRR
jgi:hypothetical protein